ncbi:hypothetical protein [Thiorhodospira sibirica]|uniref:chorismate transformation enzyme, FkbO/Hyg5 family n=1 Tax=Thiorhodospira sibirica TaxID=154347 RepID=UPI00022C0AF9|nr:hypothetical protein [Thiorhodospira sibirica]
MLTEADLSTACPRVHLHLAPFTASTQVTQSLIQIGFGEAHQASTAHPGLLQVGLPPLGQTLGLECWEVSGPIERGQVDGLAYNYTEDFLFGWLLLEDSAHGDAFQRISAHAYTQLLGFVRESGYPHILRIWNYFSAIHQLSDGLDRYQQFCLGRHQALCRAALQESELPAATAIGTATPGLLIYFLAGKQPGQQLENPRQLSAFQYPRRYGPQSPSFSRATLSHCGQHRQLYISGTASIVGHETVHQDPIAQSTEIINNLKALLEQARLGIEHPGALDLIKVYVRDPAMQPAIAHYLQQVLGGHEAIIYLRGDICRTDLLVEIEALCLNCPK